MLARLLLLAALAGIAAPVVVADDPPPPAREFRAVWVATVANIDWPSKPGLAPAEWQAEARAILNRAASLRLNAIVLQVRPAADALYRSDLEPWSYYLTGKQGQAPAASTDPLTFWIEEAHRRGIVLHAWLNPFRARLGGADYELAASHVGRVHPDWVKSYGGSLWLDPGEEQARAHTLAVVTDLVRRYDLDGIHMDDYFYPYPVNDPATGEELDFPDEPSWNAYRAAGGQLERADWRRHNVSALIEAMYGAIKREKPRVMLGISPFGIPRPGLPEGVVGFDQYAKLYADTVRWLREGWCDYWSPQLYWKVDAPGQPYRPLLEYWLSQNAKERHMWPGLSISRVGDGEKGYAPEEILRQIAIARETKGASGNVLFSMKALMANRRNLSDRLAEGPYAEPALMPLSSWLPSEQPDKPALSVQANQLTIRPASVGENFLWAVWTRTSEGWKLKLLPAHEQTIAIDDAKEITVKAIDRLGVESAAVRQKIE